MKAALKYVGKSRYTLEDLKEIITILRAPDGCPWDREQDHKSIRRDFLEECYEAIEAIDTEDPVLLREELGDVLFQVAFHSELEREAGRFDLDDVISDVAAKMVQRHPHVFADVTADTTEQVLTNWGGILSQLTGVTKTYLKMATRSLGPNGELMLVFDDKNAYEYVEQNRSDCQDALKAAAADRIGKEVAILVKLNATGHASDEVYPDLGALIQMDIEEEDF